MKQETRRENHTQPYNEYNRHDIITLLFHTNIFDTVPSILDQCFAEIRLFYSKKALCSPSRSIEIFPKILKENQFRNNKNEYRNYKLTMT